MEYCVECDIRLTGFEEEICMNCANQKMVEDKEYTKKTIANLKEMGYSKKEILEEIKDYEHIKKDEIDL